MPGPVDAPETTPPGGPAKAGLGRMTALAQRRRWVIIAVCALLAVVAAPFAARQDQDLIGGGFVAPDSASAAVDGLVARAFPAVGSQSLALVVIGDGGTDRADVAAAVRDGRARIADHRGVTPGRVTVGRFRDGGGAARPVAIVPISFVGGDEASIDLARDLGDDLGISNDGPGRADGARAAQYLVGQGALWAAFQAESKVGAQRAELIAFPAIGLFLLLAFGSLLATAIPLVVAGVSITITAALIYLTSQLTSVSALATTISTMIGLGVVVDYSLFVVWRYREELREHGDHDHALRTAMATSGVATVFSGVTVIVALSGLFFIDSVAIRSIAVGAIIAVVIPLFLVVTLLPASIAVVGQRMVGRQRRGGRPSTFWTRWTAAVMRRPVVLLVATLSFLLLLAAPALQMSIGNRGLDQLPSDNHYRVGYAAVSQVLGPSRFGPVMVTVQVPRGGSAAAVRAATAAVRRDPSVVADGVTATGGREGVTLIQAPLRTDPEGDAARAAVDRLRGALDRAVPGPSAARVGGTTATIVDFDRMVADQLPLIFAFVLLMSFVVLVVVLRSIVLPVKAVVMNVVTVGAAYGILVIVFQWGWLEGLGLQKSEYIDTVTPPLVLTIAFGLSMDYEVFLLSRIRERYLATGDPTQAVAEGLRGSARPITSAAAIMIVAFLAFVSASVPAVQRFGLASAAAVALDATLVRLVLVPATMQLFGAWNWWLPGWLDRRLPHVWSDH